MPEHLADLATLETLAVVLIAFAGGFVRGYTGFGNGLVMAPLLTLFWGPVDAVSVTVLLSVVAMAQLAPPAIRTADWREAAPMLVAMAVITPIGTYALVSFDPVVIKRVIAGAVLLATLINLSGYSYRGPRGPAVGILFGSMGALLNGVAGVGGPPVVLYLISSAAEARVQRANIIMVMGIGGMLVMVYMIIAGAITELSAWRTLGMAAPFGIGVWGGQRLFRRLPGKVFRVIVLWFLLAVSATILIAD